MEQFVSLWGIEFRCTETQSVISSTSHSLSSSSFFCCLPHISISHSIIYCLLKWGTCHIAPSKNWKQLYCILIWVAQDHISQKCWFFYDTGGNWNTLQIINDCSSHSVLKSQTWCDQFLLKFSVTEMLWCLAPGWFQNSLVLFRSFQVF